MVMIRCIDCTDVHYNSSTIHYYQLERHKEAENVVQRSRGPGVITSMAWRSWLANEHKDENVHFEGHFLLAEMRWQEAQMAFTTLYEQRCGGRQHSLPITSEGEVVVVTTDPCWPKRPHYKQRRSHSGCISPSLPEKRRQWASQW